MKSVLAWIFLPCVVLAFYIGNRLGSEAKQHPAAEELKLTAHNLERASDGMSPQLREYLKGRAYSLLIGGVRSDWVNDKIDYGPIDRSVLGAVSVVKGPESDQDLYRLAMEAAGIKTAEQVSSGNGGQAR
jgi:hypothetical protein